MTLARKYGVTLATLFLAASVYAVNAGSAPRWNVLDRPVRFEAGALRVQCDEAVAPVVATAHIEDDASKALRIGYRLAANSNAVYVRTALFDRSDIPEIPWGVGFHIHRPAKGLTIALFATDSGGELWEYVMPRIAPWKPAGPRRVEIPFSWFKLVPWERRDGAFDPSTLETLSFRLTNADAQHPQQGEVVVSQLALLDARRPAAAIDVGAFALLDLAAAFNSDGVATRSNPLDGDFHTGDWQHRALPAEEFPKPGVATLVGISFVVPNVEDGRDNHIRCNGQRLAGFASGNYSALYALAAGKFGRQLGDAVLRYHDGTSEPVLLEVSDWTDGPNRGDVVAVRFSETYHGTEVEDRQPKLYVQSLRVDVARILESIELPENDFLKIFALSLAKDAAPPNVGALQSQRLTDVYPRYAIKPLADLEFSQPPRGAGVYGDYLRRTGNRYSLEEYWSNGSLAFTLDVERLPGRLPRMPVSWTGCLGHDRPLVLGRFVFPGASFKAPRSSIPDWTCIAYQTESETGIDRDSIEALLSRAWPAMRLDSTSATVHWQVGGERNKSWIAMATGNGVTTYAMTSDPLPALVEPWLLTWTVRPELDFAAPMLLVLQNRPDELRLQEIEDVGSSIALHFAGGAGGICAMPLHGIERVPTSDTEAWARDGLPAEVVARCRQWARRLQRFPTAAVESYRSDSNANAITVTTNWTFRGWDTAWDIEPDPVALIPPVVTLARDNGYSARIVSDIVESSYHTFWGPAALVAGDMTEVTLSSPRYVASAPIPARVTGAPLLDTITAALHDAIAGAVPESLATHRYASAGDEAKLRVLAPSYLSLGEWREGIEPYMRGVAMNVLHPNNLKVEKEPITGQFYLMDDRFWAKDDLYDKEWQIGYMLQVLWSYAYFCGDTAFLKEHWNAIRGLYAYYQIVFDWATGSTFTMANGYNANSDGTRIAWEGMLAMARMAAMVGDGATYLDAVARSSKQMLSLYASWYAPQWAASNRYMMMQYRPVSGKEAELRFAPDNSWTEFFTCNLSHSTDFFQTTHAFYFFNLSYLAFLHDSSIGETFLRPWLEEVIPQLHPNWCDSNIFSEPSGQYYGGGHTMAHLVARALVLGEDTEQLYACYRQSTEDAQVSTQWYKPPSVAAETLTAMLMAAAPIVYAPVLQAYITENSFDAAANRQRIRMRGEKSVEAALYVRTGARRATEVRIDSMPRNPVWDEASGELRIALALERDQETIVEFEYL